MGFLTQWSGDNTFKDPNIAEIVAFCQTRIDLVKSSYSNKFTDYRLDLLNYPDKDKLVADFNEDMVKTVLSKDVEETWKGIVANHQKNGYDKIVEEVNSAAAVAGIK